MTDLVAAKVARPLARSAGRRVLRTGPARVGIGLLGAVVAVDCLGPVVAPFKPSSIVGAPLTGPGARHLLGTDVLGRDVLSRLLYGGFNLTWMALLAMAVGTVAGCCVGLAAAHKGGVVDGVLMRLMDVAMSFPELILVMLVVAMLGRSPVLTALLVGVAYVPGLSRVMRGAAQPVLDSEHVQWSKAIGVPPFRILVREVVPLVIAPLMVEAGMRLVWAIGAIASLNYLGFGVQPPSADWGLMVGENQDALSVAPLTVFAPIVMISILALGGNLLAEGVARAIGRTEGNR